MRRIRVSAVVVKINCERARRKTRVRARRASILTVKIDLFVPRAKNEAIHVWLSAFHKGLGAKREREGPDTRDSFLVRRSHSRMANRLGQMFDAG